MSFPAINSNNHHYIFVFFTPYSTASLLQKNEVVVAGNGVSWDEINRRRKQEKSLKHFLIKIN